jgi:hypothetical protein
MKTAMTRIFLLCVCFLGLTIYSTQAFFRYGSAGSAGVTGSGCAPARAGPVSGPTNGPTACGSGSPANNRFGMRVLSALAYQKGYRVQQPTNVVVTHATKSFPHHLFASMLYSLPETSTSSVGQSAEVVAAPAMAPEEMRARNDEVVTFIRMAHLSESGSDFKFMKTNDKVRIVTEMSKLFELDVLGVAEKMNFLWTAVQLEVEDQSFDMKGWYQRVLRSIMFSLNVLSGEDLARMELSARSTRTFLIELGKNNKLPFAKFTLASKKHIFGLFEKAMAHPQCSIAEFAGMCATMRSLAIWFPVSSRSSLLSFFNTTAFKDGRNIAQIGELIEDILLGVGRVQANWYSVPKAAQNILVEALMTQMDRPKQQKHQKPLSDHTRISRIMVLLGELEFRWASILKAPQKDRIFDTLESNIIKMSFRDFTSLLRGLGRSKVAWPKLRDSLKTAISYRMTDFPYFDVADRIASLEGLSEMSAELSALPKGMVFKICENFAFIENCTARDFSRVTYSLGKMVANRSPRLQCAIIASFIQRFIQLIPRFNQEEFADSLFGISRLGLFASDRGYMTRLDRVNSSAIQALPVQLAEAISGIFSSFTAKENGFLQSFSMRDLHTVLDALAELRFQWVRPLMPVNITDFIDQVESETFESAAVLAEEDADSHNVIDPAEDMASVTEAITADYVETAGAIAPEAAAEDGIENGDEKVAIERPFPQQRAGKFVFSRSICNKLTDLVAAKVSPQTSYALSSIFCNLAKVIRMVLHYFRYIYGLLRFIDEGNSSFDQS